MVFYIIFWSVSLVLLVMSAIFRPNAGFFYMAFFLILACVAGFRGDVGQDTLSYGNIYLGMTNLDALKFVFIRQEPFLNVLMFFHHALFNSYTGFLVLVAFLQAALLAYATRNMHHKQIFLAFYILIFYLELHFNALRVGFALLFMISAVSDMPKNPVKSAAWALLALLSHVSIVCVFPVLALRAGMSVKRMATIALGAIVIMGVLFFFYSDLILLKIGRYEWFNLADFSFPKLTALLVFVLFSSASLSRKIRSDELYCMAFLSLALFLSSLSEIAYRIYHIALLLMLYLFFSREIVSFGKLKFQPVAIGIFAACLWFSFSSINSVAFERQRIGTDRGSLDFTYIPYKFYFESRYRQPE